MSDQFNVAGVSDSGNFAGCNFSRYHRIDWIIWRITFAQNLLLFEYRFIEGCLKTDNIFVTWKCHIPYPSWDDGQNRFFHPIPLETRGKNDIVWPANICCCHSNSFFITVKQFFVTVMQFYKVPTKVHELSLKTSGLCPSCIINLWLHVGHILEVFNDKINAVCLLHFIHIQPVTNIREKTLTW
jgi:hypothetical protein